MVIPLSPAEKNSLAKIIHDGLANSPILKNTAPWAAPVLLTSKKEGNIWPFFDYQRYNHCEDKVLTSVENVTFQHPTQFWYIYTIQDP